MTGPARTRPSAVEPPSLASNVQVSRKPVLGLPLGADVPDDLSQIF